MRLTPFKATLLLALSLATIFGSAHAATRQTAEFAQSAGRYSFQYLSYLPPGYESDTGKKWPLMVFLHGAGETASNLTVLANKGPLLRIQQGRDYPCIVLSPLAQYYNWEVYALDAFIKDMCEKYRVDRDRIYLTGLSMGGFGTWNLATYDPTLFAAIAPLCGGGNAGSASVLKDMPVWAFHGALDTTVPLSQSQVMIDAIRRAGGDPLFTIYPGLGHDVWSVTYANDELFTWMFAQSRATDPVIVRSPDPVASSIGDHATFRATTTGTNLSYRWTRNGATIPGATSADLYLPKVSDADEGLYSVEISNSRGKTQSTAAVLWVGAQVDTPRLTALSVRALAGQGERSLIMGLTINESGDWVYAQALGMDGPRLPVLLRGVGSSLEALHVTGAITDPKITLHAHNGVRSSNDNWGGDSLIAQLGEMKGLDVIKSDSHDAALYETLRPGSYSVHVNPVQSNGDGIALAECYEVNGGLAENTPILHALAARAYVTPGDGTFIAGLVVAGSRPLKVLIRAIGPGLGAQSITGFLADPILSLYSGGGIIASNDNWGGDATLVKAVSAAKLTALPPDSADSAIVVTLPAGSYTAHVSSKNSQSGIAMIEVYAIDE